MPEDASGFDEITLTFDPGKACIPDGHDDFSGLDSLFIESSAVLLYEEEGWWNYSVRGMEGIGLDGTLPILYLDDDSLFSITFTPSAFYGTGTELIKGITAVFKEMGSLGMDYSEEGCKDFYIPFELDTVEVSFSADMSHQIFLGKFDPFFDNIDMIGNFNDWGNPLGTDLEDPDGDSIYSVIIPDMFVGQTIKYLFRRNRNDATSESLEGTSKNPFFDLNI